MPDRDITHLHPDLQPICQQWLKDCISAGLIAKVTFTWRSIAEQDALYAKGRTTLGNIVTYARGGQSPHNFTLPDGTPASKAFDFSIFRPDGSYVTDGTDMRYCRAGEIGKTLGLVYGGDWPKPKTDSDHLELSDLQQGVTV